MAGREAEEGEVMPERLESAVYGPATTKLMKDAFEAAWRKARLIDQDKELTRRQLASAIIDQVDAGVRDRDRIVTAVLATLP
jgi:hypothetical protein